MDGSKNNPYSKQYYWETGCNTTDRPRSVILWHTIVGTLSHAIQWLDRIGKPVVHATGLTASRFDYVIHSMTDEQKQMAMEMTKGMREKRENERETSVPPTEYEERWIQQHSQEQQ